ncbi:hypothetical protein GGS21DRAFT_533701 [Xylaria nigripes]|nr:hypothetical protein GGS21DRAFT_533701 [Xylaria nigripes]
MLRKKEVYTVITPIPSFIPRQLAVDILHSHGEIINLNPLVLGYKQIHAPRNAAADEYFSTWYEIVERVQFVPGMGKFGAGKISFNACFHDLPWGLQTHVYAPLSIDMRNKYRICGNQPGFEPPEPPEIGLAELGVPKDGLYLREDIEIRCNITMVTTVKTQMKASSKEMIERIIKKAELLDAGVLQAMVQDGMIKTYKPQKKASYTGGLDNQPFPPQLSPRSSTPSLSPYQVPRPMSPQAEQQWVINNQTHQESFASKGIAIPMELPGDFYYSPSVPRSQTAEMMVTNIAKGDNAPGQRFPSRSNSTLKGPLPPSYVSDSKAPLGPGQKGCTVELPAHFQVHEQRNYPSDDQKLSHQHIRPYNPANYALPVTRS